MLKNKYVLGVLIAVAIFGVSAGGGILLLGDSGPDEAAQISGASSTAGVTTGSDGSITLSPTESTGMQLSQNTPTPTTNTNSAQAEAVKLLDPKTFAQYDKYREAQNSSYIDLYKGSGAKISAGTQVAVLYKGWLTDGTLFDQSKPGTNGTLQSFTFTQGQHQVIPGWESGLDGAQEGGVRFLIIPPAVGYGAAGQGPIPGNAVLIFQVEIAQVK